MKEEDEAHRISCHSLGSTSRSSVPSSSSSRSSCSSEEEGLQSEETQTNEKDSSYDGSDDNSCDGSSRLGWREEERQEVSSARSKRREGREWKLTKTFFPPLALLAATTMEGDAEAVLLSTVEGTTTAVDATRRDE